jgi:hypothetical protein
VAIALLDAVVSRMRRLKFPIITYLISVTYLISGDMELYQLCCEVLANVRATDFGEPAP